MGEPTKRPVDEPTKQPEGNESQRPLRQRVGSLFSGMTGWMTAAAALIVAVAGALTAVGVTGGSTGPAGTTLRGWAARANEICGRSNDTIAALPIPRSIKNRAEAEDLVRSVVTIQRQMLRELTALLVPPSKERQVTLFLRTGAEMSGVSSEFLDDLIVGDISGMRSRLAELSRVSNEFNSAAIRLGATTCAEGGSVSDVFGGS